MKLGLNKGTFRSIFNPLVTNGLSHPYHLVEYTTVFRGIRTIFSFNFIFLLKS